MALTPEWEHRIKRWEEALWNSIYQPLGSLNLEGFSTTLRLTPESAAEQIFQPMPAGTPWGGKWEYGWFRTRLVTPEGAAGKRLVVRLEPGGESLVWINGRVMGSVGWGHREITLSRSARAGESFDLLIEAYAGHGRITVGDGPNLWGMQTVPEPPAQQTRVGDCTYGVWREEVYQLAVDFTTLFELRGLLDPLSLRVSEIDEGLMDATRIIDFELPEEQMLETMRAGRERLKPLLACRNGSTAPTLFAFGHAHIDVAWLWPLQETERKIARTAINQLALIEEYPEFRFLQSQPHLYTMLKKHYPELYERFTAAVRAGKVIADGGMWVEADTNISGGESLIRQILYGKQFFREVLGVDSRVLWLPDVFGYSGALPQILKGCGMMGFTTQKITWAYGGGDPFPYNTFWWVGIDGTEIPAHIFTDYNSQTRPRFIHERWNNRLQKNGIQTMIMAFGWGDGGGGPERDHLEFLRRAEDLEGLPRVRLASPEAFFEDLRRRGLPKERYVGELYFQAHRGTYTSQAKTKKGNRKSEFALREAEFWATAARSLKGFAFDAVTLRDAWTKVLLNQFHDILPGSSIQRVYQEAEVLHSEAIAEAQETAQKAAQVLTGDGESVVVFNSLNWPRKVLVEAGKNVVEVEVPPCGWTTVESGNSGRSAESASSAGLLADGGAYLENDLLRAEFNAKGELVSLVDKETGRQQMAGAGNRFCMYKDVPDIWDAWDLNSMTEELPVALPDDGKLEVMMTGPQVARLRLTRKLLHSELTQIISLRRGSRRIDFATGIDWQESHKLLKVNFPVTIWTDEAIHEIQFGHLRRPNHRSRPYDADRFEVCNHKWSALVEEGRGVAVLNDCKYGLSVKGNSINLTLLKSPLAPDMYADKGLQTFTYALYYWNGCLFDSGVVQEAYDLNVPPLVIRGAGGTGSLFSIDAPNIILETVKPAEDGSGDVILRLYESMRTATTCQLRTALPFRSAVETDMLEAPIHDLAREGEGISMEFRPFEIKTVRLRMH
ncbi:MAG TPA: alpha-mannosidase [Anaerolinea thermolimosa]|uniref:Alpha-mannosidase n=1 Tax=Anaerolinea thermolimosa TaxID=229919 RepID=A0A3D1JG37_9CHLR|nr:glycoside hydrolase family 38 C-terminal domain-containing protein [Anaerolinea thermolimosa]GAP06217.1 alpha-mannosidase [Anaerolinea thermolimosa]HCE16728.1 alpha-mannosidase [Anaerolinea thermolimosa]